MTKTQSAQQIILNRGRCNGIECSDCCLEESCLRPVNEINKEDEAYLKDAKVWLDTNKIMSEKKDNAIRLKIPPGFKPQTEETASETSVEVKQPQSIKSPQAAPKTTKDKITDLIFKIQESELKLLGMKKELEGLTILEKEERNSEGLSWVGKHVMAHNGSIDSSKIGVLESYLAEDSKPYVINNKKYKHCRILTEEELKYFQ